MIVATAISSAAACVASLVLTALVRVLARRIGLMDHPDARRKLHGEPTPLGGGVAIFLGFGAVVGAVLLLPNPWNVGFHKDTMDALALLVGCTAILVLGLVDDFVGLRGRHKLLGQILIALVLVSSGMVIRQIGVFGHEIELGLLAWPVTVLWLVGAVNALNLLDGIDGLATILGIILCATIAALALMTGHPAVAMVALVFSGSLLGFLWHNFPPARIFLGDSGSMLIGLMIAVLAIHASLKGAGTVLLAAPLAVFTIPLFDITAAILRRKLTGQSIYATDRGHMHHRLLDRLRSPRSVLLWIGVACAATSAGALASVFLKADWVAVVSCSAVVAMFVVTGVFGRGETLLVLARLRTIAVSFLRPSAAQAARACQSVVRLQGSRQWDVFWETLVESVEKLALDEVRFDVNSPAAREGYHASWKRSRDIEIGRCWIIEFPLTVKGSAVGRVRVAGRQDGEAAYENMEQVLDLLHPFQSDMEALFAAELPAAAPPPGTATAGKDAKPGRRPARNRQARAGKS
jgi:UDP-GlcNAc:undecaprenyl-phosphate GlcNAc-1-phosphate transferase